MASSTVQFIGLDLNPQTQRQAIQQAVKFADSLSASAHLHMVVHTYTLGQSPYFEATFRIHYIGQELISKQVGSYLPKVLKKAQRAAKRQYTRVIERRLDYRRFLISHAQSAYQNQETDELGFVP